MSDHGDEPYEARPADDQEINGDLGKRSRTLSRKGLQYAVEEKRGQTITIHKRLRGVIRSVEEADSITDSVLNNLVTTAEEFLKPVSIAPAVFCSGLTNEIQCLIVITRKYLALRTKTNKRPSSKQIRMEVRLVEGFFFLSRQDHNRGFAALNRSFATKKKPSGTQGIRDGVVDNLAVIARVVFTLEKKIINRQI